MIRDAPTQLSDEYNKHQCKEGMNDLKLPDPIKSLVASSFPVDST